MMSHMLSPTTKQCPILSDTEIESHPKKPWRGPGAGLVRAPRPKPRSRPCSKTEAAEPASLRPKPRSRPRFAEPSNGRSSD